MFKNHKLHALVKYNIDQEVDTCLDHCHEIAPRWKPCLQASLVNAPSWNARLCRKSWKRWIRRRRAIYISGNFWKQFLGLNGWWWWWLWWWECVLSIIFCFMFCDANLSLLRFGGTLPAFNVARSGNSWNRILVQSLVSMTRKNSCFDFSFHDLHHLFQMKTFCGWPHEFPTILRGDLDPEIQDTPWTEWDQSAKKKKTYFQPGIGTTSTTKHRSWFWSPKLRPLANLAF